MSETLTFIDIETTGFSPRLNRITEIGIVVVANDQIVDEYQTLVNPQQPISYYVSELTGITQADIDNAPRYLAKSNPPSVHTVTKVYL